MDTTRYPILIAECNSADIKYNARKIGVTHMRKIGSGHWDDNPENPNSLITFYALPDPQRPGDEWRVADGNGDPDWEEQDPQSFRELAALCGVSLN